MPAHAPWIALEGSPITLWNERFGPNVELVAARPFGLERLAFTGHLDEQPGFAHTDAALIQTGDTLKLVATASGRERHGDHTHGTGPLFIYLHQQGGIIQRVVSPDPLTDAWLAPESLQRFLRDEPATFFAHHADNPADVVELERIRQEEARTQVALLRSLPSPGVLRVLREGGVDVSDVEAAIRDVFARVDPQHGAEASTLEITIESAGMLNGSLQLTRFKKELGL